MKNIKQLQKEIEEHCDTIVGKGWKYILLEFCNTVLFMSPETIKELEINQIKEKFGTLRIYIDNGNDEVYNAITIAEMKSSITCEVCGEPAITRWDLNWVLTLCDKHYQDRIGLERAE